MNRDASSPPIVGWISTLAETTRARILRMVERQELNVGELSAILDLPQSTTSRHLKQLSDDGWLTAQRDGTSRLYRFTEQLPAPQRALWDLVRENLGSGDWLERDDDNLEAVIAQRRTKSQEFFAGAAAHWDVLRDELFGSLLELNLLAALMPTGSVLADLGCGTGRLSDVVAPYAERVVAIDNSEAMLAAAGKRLERHRNVILERGALDKLPIPTQSTDFAVLSMVLHYVPEPLPVLREAARILKPGGSLIIADLQTHNLEDYRARMGHVWSGFTPEQLAEWITASGLRLTHSHRLPSPQSGRTPGLLLCAGSR